MLIPRPRMTRPVGFCMFWRTVGRGPGHTPSLLIKMCQVPVLSLPSSLVSVSTYQHPHKAQIDGQLLCKLSHIKTQSVVFTFEQTIAYHVCDIMADLNIIISEYHILAYHHHLNVTSRRSTMWLAYCGFIVCLDSWLFPDWRTQASLDQIIRTRRRILFREKCLGVTH